MTSRIDPIRLEILWTRLISMVDEAGTALKRTAFSEIIRDAADYGCGLFDTEYNLLAQCNFGTPGFLGALPSMMKEFGEAYPPETLQPGDVLITDLPWVCCGHTNDITLASPIYFKERLVAYGICIAHHMDVGGRSYTSETRDVYEEGFLIPILKLYEGGSPNDIMFKFIRANVRNPNHVIGDLRAQLAGLDMMARRLTHLLEDYNMEDIQDLSHEILNRTEAVVRASIRQCPEGTCSKVVPIDKIDGQPINIAVTVTLKNGEIVVDYTGTSPQLPTKAINVCFNHTQSQTALALKCVVSPSVPNNSGGLRPIKVIAPEASIVNARFPAPVNMRTAVVLYLPEIVFSALADLMPDRVIAGSGGTPGWYFGIVGQRQNGHRYFTRCCGKGGLGARSNSDGVPTLSFPANGAISRIEIAEGDGPVFFIKRELHTDSAGAGKYRGGMGTHQIVKILEGDLGASGPSHAVLQAGRMYYPVPALFGGQEGPLGVTTINGEAVKFTARPATLMPGDSVEFFVPGGGGYGDPLERDPSLVEQDIRNGFVSPEAAKNLHGVIMDKSGWNVDIKATKKMRAVKRQSR